MLTERDHHEIVRRKNTLLAVGVALVAPFCLSLSYVHAEAPQRLAALGLSGADGTVRAQANVRLAVSVAQGSRDFAVQMGEPVRTKMPEVRACFGEAVGRSSAVQGQAVFELEALTKGRARAKVVSNQTKDRAMVECMRASFASAVMPTQVPRGARSLITLDLVSSTAQAPKPAQRAKSPVKLLPGGRAESQGGTQQGEVQFRISGSANARAAIEALHEDVSSRFAGLLDCRRKSSRRNQPATGTVTVSLKLEEGRVERARSRGERSAGFKAPACVTEWVERADRSHLVPAELELAITFGGET